MSEATPAPAAEPSAPAAQAAQQPADAGNQTITAPAAGSVDDLPKWAQQTIADLRKENANHREAKQQAAAEAAKAEEKRLEAERKFEELAAQRQQRIAELEPIADRYNALAARLTADLEAEIAKLPAEIQAMRPDAADLDSLIDWTEKARSLSAKMQAAQATGAGPLPRPANQAAKPAASQAAQLAAMRSKF